MKKNHQFFRLVNNDVLDECVKSIFLQFQKSDKVLNVKITDNEEKRTSGQNRLYWFWVDYFSKKTGTEPLEVHFDFRRRFLLKIYYVDDAGFAAMCDSIKQLKTTDLGNYKSISKQVIELTSTTKATTEQMTRYLDAIYAFCYGENIMLPIPDELKYLGVAGSNKL